MGVLTSGVEGGACGFSSEVEICFAPNFSVGSKLEVNSFPKLGGALSARSEKRDEDTRKHEKSGLVWHHRADMFPATAGAPACGFFPPISWSRNPAQLPYFEPVGAATTFLAQSRGHTNQYLFWGYFDHYFCSFSPLHFGFGVSLERWMENITLTDQQIAQWPTFLQSSPFRKIKNQHFYFSFLERLESFFICYNSWCVKVTVIESNKHEK